MVEKTTSFLMQRIWLQDDSDGLKVPFWFYKILHKEENFKFPGILP